MLRCQNERRISDVGSKEVTRQRAADSVHCVQDPARENHHLICQVTAVRLLTAARHNWRLRWVRRSPYWRWSWSCFTSPASGSQESTTDSIFAEWWVVGGDIILTAQGIGDRLEDVINRTARSDNFYKGTKCHVTNHFLVLSRVPLNFTILSRGFSIRNVIRKIYIKVDGASVWWSMQMCSMYRYIKLFTP